MSMCAVTATTAAAAAAGRGAPKKVTSVLCCISTPSSYALMSLIARSGHSVEPLRAAAEPSCAQHRCCASSAYSDAACTAGERGICFIRA